MDQPVPRAYRQAIRRCGIFAVGLVLAACGGGSGGGSTPPPPAGNTVVSGKISFERVPHQANNGLNYNATRADPVRGVRVELLSATGAILASATTDAAGDYSMTVASNQSVRLRARAQMLRSGVPGWDFQVIDNTAAGAQYVLDGPLSQASGATQTRDLLAVSGWGGSSYTTTRAAAPFAILDSIYLAYNKVLAVDPQVVFPALAVNWSEDNRPLDGDLAVGEITTSFYQRDTQGNSAIYLLGAANNDTDEYDGHVVIHEWGHYLEDRLSRSDSVGGAHSGGDRLDPRVAYSEGLGYALAGIVTDDPVTRDSGGFDQAAGFSIDVERSSNLLNPGWFSEDSLQSIIYDLYDGAADDADTLELGFAPLYDVLTGAFASDAAFATIFSFVEFLKAARPGDVAAINAVVAAQDIVVTGNDRYGSAENNNAGNAQDVLPIYTQLPIDGTPVIVCSIAQFGNYNKLSNRRYLRFALTAGQTGTYRLAVSGGTDPDILLFQGQLLAIEETVGPDTITRTLQAGEHVVEVYEYSNVDDTSGTPGRSCLTVTLAPA